MRFYSPLRYPGGKNKAFALFRDIILANGLKNCVYVEPFAGGASVALGLLMEGNAERVIINDADLSIYSFWYSCLNNVGDFCDILEQTEVNIDTWHQQKEIYREQRVKALNGEEYDTLQLGFATFFLNRCNRSGILKGGIIGGHKQTGNYGITARFNKLDLLQRIKRIAAHSERIELHCEDAKSFLERNCNSWPASTLIYCDPPYVQKGRGLYMNYFKQEDHKALSETIRRIEGKRWIVTYDMDPLIVELYRDYLVKKLTLSYSASHNRSSNKSDEYIFFSPGLIIPENKRLSDL